MPPVSVTMQALNEPVVDAPAPDVLDGVVAELLGADVVVLEPQAAASRAMTPRATPFLIIPRTVTSSTGAAGPPCLLTPPGCAKASPGAAVRGSVEAPSWPRCCRIETVKIVDRGQITGRSWLGLGPDRRKTPSWRSTGPPCARRRRPQRAAPTLPTPGYGWAPPGKCRRTRRR